MDIIKKELLNNFEKFLETNQNFWRTSRISTFIDLIIVETNKYEKKPSKVYFEIISNYLLAAKINLELGVKPIPQDISNTNIEEIAYLFDYASQVVDTVFSKVNKSILEEEFNFYQEVVYLRNTIKLLNTNQKIESDFIDDFYLKLIARYIKNYFSL